MDGQKRERAKSNTQSDDASRFEMRMLILAAEDRDAEIIRAAANQAGLSSKRVLDVNQLCTAITEGAAGAILVEPVFARPDIELLRQTLDRQPPWSALPTLMVYDVDQDEGRARFFSICEQLGPSRHAPYLATRRLKEHASLLAVWIRNALDARRRQYAARDVMAQLDLERRFNLAILAALPVGILVTDRHGSVTKTNAAFQRMWGGAIQVLKGTEEPHLFKARRADGSGGCSSLERRISHVLETGRASAEEELDIEPFDGVRRTILSSALPFRNGGGEVAGVLVLAIEITERARAERSRQILSAATAALLDSLDLDTTLRKLCRSVVTHLADCCVIYEADELGELRRLLAESSGARSADEAARLLAFAPPKTGNSLAARVLKSGKAVLLSEGPGDWLATGLEADAYRAAFADVGEYSMMVLPLVARGRKLGVLGIINTRPDRRYDARDLALAEEISRRAALALDNARLHADAQAAVRARDRALAELDAFLDASPVGFILLDRELRFRRANRIYCEWHGRAAEEILGRSYEEVVSPQLASQAGPQFQRVITTGKVVKDEVKIGEFPPGSGRTLHQLASFVPVLDVDGSPRAVGVAITDVTKLKETEDALREEALFRERFIGVLAHDLRNPLNAIVMSAGALLHGGDSPAFWRRTVGRIAHAADRMMRMTSNLLDLARGRQGGGIPIARTATDVARVVHGVVDELEASHPGRSISVSIEGDTRADIDPDRIAEVVSNLAGNALSYSQPGSPVQVRISGGDEELSLIVHNEGPPIPRESLNKIFLPFHRYALGAGGSMRGLGLGLFIVGEITRAHRGTVAVASSPEEGTTFTVCLPRADPTSRRAPDPCC